MLDLSKYNLNLDEHVSIKSGTKIPPDSILRANQSQFNKQFNSLQKVATAILVAADAKCKTLPFLKWNKHISGTKKSDVYFTPFSFLL